MQCAETYVKIARFICIYKYITCRSFLTESYKSWKFSTIIYITHRQHLRCNELFTCIIYKTDRKNINTRPFTASQDDRAVSISRSTLLLGAAPNEKKKKFAQRRTCRIELYILYEKIAWSSGRNWSTWNLLGECRDERRQRRRYTRTSFPFATTRSLYFCAPPKVLPFLREDRLRCSLSFFTFLRMCIYACIVGIYIHLVVRI